MIFPMSQTLQIGIESYVPRSPEVSKQPLVWSTLQSIRDQSLQKIRVRRIYIDGTNLSQDRTDLLLRASLTIVTNALLLVARSYVRT